MQKQKVEAQSGIIEVFDQKYFLDKRKAAPSGATGCIGTKDARPDQDALDDVRGYPRFPINNERFSPLPEDQDRHCPPLHSTLNLLHITSSTPYILLTTAPDDKYILTKTIKPKRGKECPRSSSAMRPPRLQATNHER